MVRAREAILSAGGAAKCNVFTRITLALFGQVPWRAVSSNASRNNASSEVVFFPFFENFLLVPNSYSSLINIDDEQTTSG